MLNIMYKTMRRDFTQFYKLHWLFVLKMQVYTVCAVPTFDNVVN